MNYRNEMTRREVSKILSLGLSSVFVKGLNSIQFNKNMNQRIIPSSNEKIPVIGLGTWQTFDVGTSDNERAPLKEVLKILIENGGSVIDSSPMYGRSEKVVGDLTSEMKWKARFFEATKVWTSGEKAGIEQMKKSMRLMKAAPMDLMQIHNLLDWQTHLPTLRKWKEEGTIRYLGITHYHKGGYAELEQIMKVEPLDFIQVNYNLKVRDASDRILPLAMDKGIAVLINRPYEGGALFRSVKGMEIPAWASEFEATSWAQIFLKFILAHPAVTCVIPGTSKAKHMRDNVKAGFGDLPDKEQQNRLVKLLA